VKTILALLLLLAATQQDLPVEQTKKNIKVLQGLPSSQLIPVMAFMSNSLGVTCAHCHNPKAYESDEKPAKQDARRMIALQRSINEQHYGGKLTVTCNTCHQGHVLTPATPDVANAGWNANGEPRDRETEDPRNLLELWPETSGVTQRVVRGIVERYNGRDEPKSAAFTLTVGPSLDYKTELSHPGEAMRALALFLLTRPAAEQLQGERWSIAPDHVRRHRETATPLGSLPEEIDYEDFRQTDSGRLPFRTRWSRADYRVTYTIESISSQAASR
jgi:hypothetical protein